MGGKGAGLAEMSRLGIPVPPGFTITTAVCGFYYRERSRYPGPLRAAVDEALAFLERKCARSFGDPNRPLLVSVRSGAPVSMPGMMDTVLNVGLSARTLSGLAAGAEGRRFALDCYRRLIEMYGDVVAGVDRARFTSALDAAKRGAQVTRDQDLSAPQLEAIIEQYLSAYRAATGAEFPQDARAQLWGAIDAVFASWMSPRAVTYRRIHGIPNDLGTAVNVQSMVFGNLGDDSATGVCFTRDPATGEDSIFGEFLPNAQGEDLVAGIRTPQPLTRSEANGAHSFEAIFPDCHRQLLDVRGRLERHFGDMQDLEFTVEKGKLYLLQTRRGKRTGMAAIRIACEMVADGIVDPPRAVLQVDPQTLTQVLAPAFGQAELEAARAERLAAGLPASPGAASGAVALSADRAVALRDTGATSVILVRHETSPEDIAGMEAAAGIVTARGGKTSHAAVVARGMGKPCVVGCEALQIDEEARVVRCGSATIAEGDPISIDGTTGEVFPKILPVRAPEILQVLDGERAPEASPTYGFFARFMAWADAERRLRVWANADTPEDAHLARQLGAEGIGLCRTEHMFFGKERILAFRRMILAAGENERREALAELLLYQRRDFLGIFEAMDGLPVTIRLLDPPLHEFLPHGADEIRRFAEEARLPERDVAARVEATREENPMLGLRGCRLGLAHPGIYGMQIRAILEAAIEARQGGVRALPEIMIPLTALDTEIDELRAQLTRTMEEVCAERDVDPSAVEFRFGTMIEIPRAALIAGKLAARLDFFSFGTNDLTQMTLGLSRDDTARLIVDYVERGLLPHDPFSSLDQEGVGELMQIAVERGRHANPKLKIGICGEHGGDPRSVEFCHRIGFDYVSCSPYRVPVARLAAAQAALREKRAAGGDSEPIAV
ncbi:MAG: pyruvate, phosphate dikinase [Planctomycetes bacterium]|nr:pyruvate, phosphate dikinase [Planctomycetota bacterium]